MKSILKLPGILWIAVTLLTYSSVMISPAVISYSGIVSFGIPIIIILNILLLALALIFKWRIGWVALVLILIGWPFVNVSVSLSGNTDISQSGIKVMNYNVKWFVDARKDNYDEVISWIKKQDADVLCFQEFYPLRRIGERFSQDYNVSMHRQHFHTAIYSKFPIVGDGLLFDEEKFNNARYADLKIGADTLRVYNVHLESIGIDPSEIQDSEGIKNEYENVRSRFLESSNERARQVEAILAHMEDSPYPIILAGDFNDVPYSYNYFQLRKKLSNAFEKKGQGLGVSFNNKIPYLRIDNQFFSSELEIKAFKTFNDIYFSDHFPQVGIYGITD